jgi:DNA-binding CsgD family transcriptional regulator/tetratricopeptide (TPR) repeat protein
MLKTRLIDRESERQALDRLLEAAHGGGSGVLVLRGDPGVGKTALLDCAMESASGFRIVRAAGVESEARMAFAALHQLCGPLLDRLDDLPAPQRDALSVAFGLSAGEAPEPFLVGLAVLSLLSASAEDEPLLGVIDDAQWFDPESAQALGFVARRLLADPIVILFATRAPTRELAGLPELVVEGLAEADARALLAATITGPPLDDRVMDRIVAETRGNPLALLELPSGLTPSELAVGFGLEPMLPLSGRIEESFQRRAAELPLDTQRLLLVAAAEQLGDPATVWRAADRLGISPEAASPAAAADLMEISDRVLFRHPLVRSAVYRAASVDERRAAHRSLALVTNAELDPDRRAWHMAAGVTGPDEQVASELERSAGRAQERGGLAAAAAFLERSAELTLDPGLQALRRLAAADADLRTGAGGRAQVLLAQSVPALADPRARAQALRMEGAIRFADGRGGETPSLLCDAATRLRDIDAPAARETLVEALEAAMWAGRLAFRTTTFDVAQAARAIPAPDGDESIAELTLRGYTERLTAGYPQAVEWWRRAARAQPDDASQGVSHQVLGMLWTGTGELLDFESNSAVARRQVRLAREQGALVRLPAALSCLAWNELLSGRIETAEALVAEAGEIASATGIPSMPGAQEIMRLAMLAWRGREEETRAVAEAVTAEAYARGQGLGITVAQYCLTTLELGHGRYEEARIAALNVFEEDPLYIGSMGLADAVEAAVRSGDTRLAQAALARLSERARATGTPWALGLLARSRALLATDEDAEPLYQAALENLGRSGVVTDFARARLLYGEWLRRRRRRRDARLQLRVAYDMLQAIGGVAFAHRAGAELLATGEHARTRVVETRDELTPREQQVAELAASGESNAAIAAQLFISQHTVAYHLRKVFGKLSLTSRSQLAPVIGGQLETAQLSR